MHLNKSMIVVIDRKRYTTKDATIIASDEYCDGHFSERTGQNQWLLKTKKGSYFLQTQTQWQGERDSIIPCTLEEAIYHYEYLPVHEVEFEKAFPGVEIEEA